MTARLGRPEESDIARMAQLELKTNQFNVTTRRYTEAELRGFLGRGDVVVLAFRLADRFGDHGLTSTLVAVQEGDALRIDSWLMSCRVFSRTAEQFVLRALIGIGPSGCWGSIGRRRRMGLWLTCLLGWDFSQRTGGASSAPLANRWRTWSRLSHRMSRFGRMVVP
jgi:hypothetical protein